MSNPSTARGKPAKVNTSTRAFSRFEWMLAGRYLRARRKDAFISVISALTIAGVAIGVATLIVVMSVMNGFRDELLSKILGLNGHFTVFPIESKFADYAETVKQLETVHGVRFAIPYVEGEALASGPAGSTGVSVRGVSLASLDKLALLKKAVQQGSFEGWDDGDGVAIGYRLAQKLGVSIGDKVTLITPKGTMTPFGQTPQIRAYPVKAIFNLGMVEFDSFFLYMPMRPAQLYFKLYQDVLKPGVKKPPLTATDAEIDAAYKTIYYATAAEVFLDDPDAVGRLRDPLQKAVSRPVILVDWQERNKTFFSALQVERVVMFVILSMIIVVAAFNIISSLVMLVKDKGQDIAILRTMGATRFSIMRIFSITGTTIGVAGTGIGLALGLLLAENAEPIRAWLSNVIGIRLFPPEVFYLSALPSKIDPSEVIFVAGLSLSLSVLATLYPAWRAAHQDPVEALRNE